KNELEYYISNDRMVIPLNELEYVCEESMEFATKWLKVFNYKLVNNNFVKCNITIVAAIEYIMYLNKDKIFINNDEGYNFLNIKFINYLIKKLILIQEHYSLE
ncbi:TPA: hypothetical protein ACH98H_002534, partial [Staphylococcus aureus]